MNLKENEITALGVPASLLAQAKAAVDAAALDARKRGTRRNFQKLLTGILKNPDRWTEDHFFGRLADRLQQQNAKSCRPPVEVQVFGREDIEDATVSVFGSFACNPRIVAAALMPDAHGCQGMPVGGVVALENAVCPGAVGLDIACRMKLSILDLPVPKTKTWDDELFNEALLDGTRFGLSEKHSSRQHHDVMDDDWTVTKITKRKKQKAWSQLGSSGGGNHFVEFGLLKFPNEFGSIQAGEYVALLSHSGSRGTGADVAKCYTKRAIEQSIQRGESEVTEQSAYLDMESEAGQEYWAAMNLMGQYAKANHDVIHWRISKFTGAELLNEIENHHNFAWLESHQGRDVYVHRKGATPAHRGQLGVIPGSMSAPAHIVVGKGNPESLCSASHGAGRKMERRKAKVELDMARVIKKLGEQGTRLLQGSVDESPAVYKSIKQVMGNQTELVDSIATFHPKVVRMSGERFFR